MAYSDVILADSPNMLLLFSEDSVNDTMVNDGDNGVDGTYQTGSLGVDACSDDNVPTFVTGPTLSIPDAINIPGDDSRARVGSCGIPGDLLSQFTIEFWCRPTAECNHTAGLTNAAHIEDMACMLITPRFDDPYRGFGIALGYDEMYAVHHGPSDLGGVQLYDGDLSGWKYYALVVDGRDVTLYIDAVEIGTFTSSSMDIGEEWSIGSVLLGLRYAAFDDCGVQPGAFKGDLAALAVFDSKLTSTQISDHYEAGINTVPSTPTLSVSVSGRDATLSGSAFSDSDGDTHDASQWQIDESGGDFSTPVTDSGEDTSNLVSYEISSYDVGDFIARLRYKDSFGQWSDWSSSISFTISRSAPDTPTGTATVSNDDVSLTSSAFSDADPDETHTASQWKVYRGGYLYFDTGEDASNLVSYALADLDNGEYSFTIRHKDSSGTWSDWSTLVTFTVDTESWSARGAGSGSWSERSSVSGSWSQRSTASGSWTQRT